MPDSWTAAFVATDTGPKLMTGELCVEGTACNVLWAWDWTVEVDAGGAN